MVHYHGGPFSDPVTAVVVWRGRHAMISFARPEQIRMAAGMLPVILLDNGAFSVWRRKAKPEFARYYLWVDGWINIQVATSPLCQIALREQRPRTMNC